MHALIRKIQEEQYPHLKDDRPAQFIAKNRNDGEGIRLDSFRKNNAHIARFATRPNVDAQDPDEVSMAFEARVYPKLVKLLSNERIIVRQKALYSLIELFLQCKENISSALDADMMEPCMDLVDDPDSTVRENALCAMGFLVTLKKGRDQFVKDQFISELIPCVSDDESPTAVRYALRVMKNVSMHVDARNLLRDTGCIPVLVSCMKKSDSSYFANKEQRLVLTECLQALQNALAADGAQEIAIEAGAVPVLNRLLQDVEVLQSSALFGCGIDKEVNSFITAACTCLTYIW